MERTNRLLRATRYAMSLLIILAMTMSLTGCSIKLIAAYDEATDQGITQLQRRVDGFLIELQRKVGTPEAAYEKNVKFYDDVRLDVDVLRVRAQAKPKNEITVEQLFLIVDNINKLETYHKLGFQKAEEIAPMLSAFDISFMAILKLELAKKRRE